MSGPSTPGPSNRPRREWHRSGARGVSAVVGVTVAALGLAACSAGDSSSKPKEIDSEIWSEPAAGDLETLKWNLPYGEPDLLDGISVASFSNAMVLANLCDPLEREAPDGTVTPALASSVEQPSPTEIVVTVAEGREFWNGAPVTAEDVRFSLDRLVTDPASLAAFSLTNIESVDKTGDDTVVIRLKSPDYYTRTQLRNVSAGIVEKKFVETAGDSYGSAQGGVMCSGPFKLASWQAGQKIVLERNDDYWDSELVPHAETVELSFVTDANTLTLALQSGQIDGSYGVPISGLDLLDKASSEGKVYFGPSPNVFNLMVNASTGKWQDERVREALALSIPYSDLAEAAYRGAAVPAKFSLAPGGWPAETAEEFQQAWDDAPEPTQDLEKAKQLLKEAGAEGLRLNLGGASDQADWKTALNVIADGATKAGFKVKIIASPNAVYQPMLYDPSAISDLDVISNEWNADYHDPRVLYSSMRADRWSKLTANDAEFNDLYAESIAAPTVEEQTAASIAVQQRAKELHDWIPVAYLYNRMWMNNRITGAPIAWGWWCYPFLAPVGAA